MKHVAIAIVWAACCIALASYAASVGRFHVEVTNECGTTAEVVLLLDIYGGRERYYRIDPDQTSFFRRSHSSREIWFRATLVDDNVVAWTGRQVRQAETGGFFVYKDRPSFLFGGGHVDFNLCGRAGYGDSVLPVR